MTVSDPIADMLTRVRNAMAVRHEGIQVPSSKIKLAIAKLLKEEGFITDYELMKTPPQDTLRVRLKYYDRRQPAITGLKRVSKLGLRVYVDKSEVPRSFGGLGIAVVSTSQGVMTGREAWQRGIGGELLCYVW
jgi:small subunit ribosomal protein S8